MKVKWESAYVKIDCEGCYLKEATICFSSSTCASCHVCCASQHPLGHLTLAWVKPSPPRSSWRLCRCDGNLGSALQVSIELSCKPFSCRVLSVAQDDGCLQCTYRPEQAGFYRLEVTSQGGHLSGSPYSVQVSPRGKPQLAAGAACFNPSICAVCL